MRLPLTSPLLISLLVIAPICLAAKPPATQPTIVPLVVGSVPPQSFIVDGIVRTSADGGIAFHVATDGERQLCALFDPNDGTPIFISDGRQSLVYDLANSRIVLVPSSRAYVEVDWNATAEKPLSFGFGVNVKSDPKLVETLKSSSFRIDRFVDPLANAPWQLGRSDRGRSFTASRTNGGVEAVEQMPGDSSWFRFTSGKVDREFQSVELEAKHIARPIPDALIAFPDLASLRRDVDIDELSDQKLRAFLAILKDGRAWMVKLALAFGDRENAKRLMPHTDWEELRRRDAELGARYRAALDRQGIRLSAIQRSSTSRPAN